MGIYRLYIPFWLYSNILECVKRRVHGSFTFHSGYIPITIGYYAMFEYTNFTFHSGYIPMLTKAEQDTAVGDFTFHSGYIPIYASCSDSLYQYRTLHSILVIFQFIMYNCVNIAYCLYIPFWLYSNSVGQVGG